MAVNSLGYRSWEGAKTQPWHRPLVIATAGIRRAWQIGWLRRLVFFAFLPSLFFAAGFFMMEQAIVNKDLLRNMRMFVPENEFAYGVQELIDSGNLTAARHEIWSWLLLTFFRSPQAVMVVLVVGLIAPPLISQDIRSRAFLLYFSRPISRTEYLLGKFFTVWFYLALISMIPALGLYLLGILLSPHVGVVTATWDLPLRIVAASAVLAVPAAAVSLCLSSMTQESRYAAFAWFAMWILGWVSFGIMSAAETISRDFPDPEAIRNRWSLFSPYHIIYDVQNWVFGVEPFSEIKWAAFILAAVTLISLFTLARNITKPMRA
ncbi:MAG: ABC transporter permease subunit [Planctomycetota bacterium]